MNSVPRRLVTPGLLFFLLIHSLCLHARQAGDKHLDKEFKKKPRVTEVPFLVKSLSTMKLTWLVPPTLACKHPQRFV